MKPIVKNENQESYNPYEINLKVEGTPFSQYVAHNYSSSCRESLAEQALELYFSNKTLKEIQGLLKHDPEELLPYGLSEINTRKDLVEYAYDILTGNLDIIPDDYVDTMMIDAIHITRMKDDEETFMMFPHDKNYIR